MNPSVLDVWEKFSADKQWHDLVVQALDGEAVQALDENLKSTWITTQPTLVVLAGLPQVF